MTYQVRYTVEAEQDLLRLAEFEFKATGDTRGTDYLQTMLRNLGENPQIGKQYDEYRGIRQIHVPFGRSGYSALYKVHDVVEVVGILRVKHQKEVDY